jgi:hypothetical protein
MKQRLWRHNTSDGIWKFVGKWRVLSPGIDCGLVAAVKTTLGPLHTGQARRQRLCRGNESGFGGCSSVYVNGSPAPPLAMVHRPILLVDEEP